MALFNEPICKMIPPYERSKLIGDPSDWESPILDELFGTFDVNFDPNKHTKNEHIVVHYVGNDDRHGISYAAKVFLEYYKKFPEIVEARYFPRWISIKYSPSDSFYYYKVDDVEKTRPRITIKLREGQKAVNLLLELPDKAKNPMKEEDVVLYNRVLSVIEDYTGKSIESTTGGVFHYL